MSAALDFLKLYAPHGPWVLTAIPPDGGGTETHFFAATDVAIAEQWIAARNGKLNLYVHAAFVGRRVDKKAEKADITALSHLWVDVDPRVGEDLEAEQRRIEALLMDCSPPPTFIVASGGGCNAYWRLREPLAVGGDPAKIEHAEGYNRALEIKLGGDHCFNVDRLLRLPGTLNIASAKKKAKGRKNVEARLIVSEPGRVYDLASFQRVDLPKVAAPKPGRALKPVMTARRLASVDELGDKVPGSIKAIIVQGHDSDDPKRWPSRSEALFYVTCQLVRAGVDDETIKAVLLDPDFGISESVLEARPAAKYADRQIERAHVAVDSEFDGIKRKDGSFLVAPTMSNARKALLKLGLTFEYDDFAARASVQSHIVPELAGGVSDKALSLLRQAIINNFDGFDPGTDNLKDAVFGLCYENSHHPVREYLDSLEWDGKLRLRWWLRDYMGAEDTPLVRAIARIMLVAAVRRVRQPGCKFDTMVVLEGPQGIGKSSALAALGGNWFSDADLFGEQPKERVLRMLGVWVYEVAELKGLRGSELDGLKAFLSRQNDRTRLPYARIDADFPRQCILIGTTNDAKYLRDRTGNRRFLPVRCGRINLKALRSDRDQLWAEAARLEARGMQIWLPRSMEPAAQAEQEARLEIEPWADLLRGVTGVVARNKEGKEVERVRSSHLLHNVLHVPADRQATHAGRRLAQVMVELGWEGPRLLKYGDGNGPAWGYERSPRAAARTPF